MEKKLGSGVDEEQGSRGSGGDERLRLPMVLGAMTSSSTLVASTGARGLLWLAGQDEGWWLACMKLADRSSG